LLARVLATWFGCGLFPKAPGTIGSLAAALLILPSVRLPFVTNAPWIWAAAALMLFPLAVWSAGETARQLGREDPQVIVIDEVVGQWIALSGASHLNWQAITIGFVLFRLFDIWKPWPVRKLEELPGGWGIVLDDCIAGTFAALVLFGCGWFNFY